MTLGTRTLLFGVHQFFLHPLFVFIAWLKLYRELPSWRELFCIAIHDWGYWGVQDIKGEKGDRHPELGASIAGRLLGGEWEKFILGHSAFYMARHGVQKSKLFGPDKYWHCICPYWLYKLMGTLSGEFSYYRNFQGARRITDEPVSDREWFSRLQKISLAKAAGLFEINREDL